MISFFAQKCGDYSREGDYFRYCLLEVVPEIVCFIFPLNKKIITSNKLNIDYFPIAHNTLCLPPKFCITYCLKMLLGKCNTPRSI